MDENRKLILNLNGVPSAAPRAGEEPFFWFDPQGAWRASQGDLSLEIETACVRLHDALAGAIFGDLEAYYTFLPMIPEFLSTAGLNSESTLSRADFEQQLLALKDLPHLNQLLYLYDCRKLVAGVQECAKEAVFLQGEFYRALNLDPLFWPPIAEPDGVRYLTSPVVTNITAVLNFIFIRLHSLLDYTTKLVFELDHLRTDFTSYPRLASANIQFGDRRRISLNGQAATLFESCDLITEIELIRNLVIHDGLLDDMPKAYKVVQGGQAVEKFVLMPDRANGRLEKFKNRNLFYSREDKINLRLPGLLAAFQARQVATLDLAVARFRGSPTKP
jgi:hypothetical protein